MSMFGSYPYRKAFWIECCFIFIFASFALTATIPGMFGDTDPLWHIAAGDLMRSTHAIPEHDPWSFTAGNYTWINISWAWDIVMSAIHEHWGWHGAGAVGAMAIALTVTLIFINCTAVCKDPSAALVSTFVATTMLPFLLRPLVITNIMIGIWLLLLGGVMRGTIKTKWLFLLPLLMIVWVNVHGGFLVGGMMLMAFFIQAALEKNRRLATAIFITGIATMFAMLCNPYGIHIIEGTLRTLNSSARDIISEWQPLTTSWTNMITYCYLILFFVLVPRRAVPVLRAERWLAYIWLVLGLTSTRNLMIFTMFSAPLVACAIAQMLKPTNPTPAAKKMLDAILDWCNRRYALPLSCLMCVGVALWLPSPMAARLYDYKPVSFPYLSPAVSFIKSHYPHARLLNHYDFGGFLIYETRGAIPVFVDPRTETAIPPAVMKDYVAFEKGTPGWEAMLDRSALDGAMLPTGSALCERFYNRIGWKTVFKGEYATIFMRVPEKSEKKHAK